MLITTLRYFTVKASEALTQLRNFGINMPLYKCPVADVSSPPPHAPPFTPSLPDSVRYIVNRYCAMCSQGSIQLSKGLPSPTTVPRFDVKL